MIYEENHNTELKREYVEDIKKSVIAFANTLGGVIYIGIADDGSVIGIENTDDTLLKISNAIRDAIKPDITLFVSYHIDKIDDKNVIAVNVQKGTACPYYLKGKGIRPEGVYIRQGASTVPATETAILKMIKDTDGDKYECIRCTNQNLTFEYTENEFERSGIGFGENQKKTMKLINEDGVFTNLAQLLSEQCVHSIKIAVFEGKEKTIFQDRIECNGSILNQIDRAYEYIDRYNKTRSEYDGLHRIDKRDYPIEAIRETLLNAVVHRDYAFSGSILISIFENRIEFVSIGGLVKGISYDDMLLGVSIQRNENLANVFYRLKLIEAFGTGIPKIMRLYDDNLYKPEIKVSDNAFKVVLPNTNYKNLLIEDIVTNEEKVMNLVCENKYVTRKEVERLLNVSQASAARILKKLVDESKILKDGKGKKMRYKKRIF